MELSPKLYEFFVRPPWFTNLYLNCKIKKLLSNLDLQDKKVLDFGCGIGTCSALFHPSSYVGIDCDDKRVAYAKRLHVEHEFAVVKEAKFPFDDQSIDYIFIMAVLHHIPTDHLTAYASEMYRVLREKGKIFIIEPCFFKEKPISNWYMSTFDKGNFIRNEAGYTEIFKRHNFDIQILKRFRKFYAYHELCFAAERR